MEALSREVWALSNCVGQSRIYITCNCVGAFVCPDFIWWQVGNLSELVIWAALFWILWTPDEVQPSAAWGWVVCLQEVFSGWHLINGYFSNDTWIIQYLLYHCWTCRLVNYNVSELICVKLSCIWACNHPARSTTVQQGVQDTHIGRSLLAGHSLPVGHSLLDTAYWTQSTGQPLDVSLLSSHVDYV